MRQVHTFPPVFDRSSEILILGSFPSVRSRSEGFFYGHPQNRFWPLMAGLFKTPVPKTADEKREFLLAFHIALWDVIESCEITGSGDGTIRGAVPNDLSPIFASASINAVFANGRTAEKLYKKFMLPIFGRGIICLPSTSPANAAFSPSKLASEWEIITGYIRNIRTER